MADFETTHKIVEKFEVAGVSQAESAFDRLASKMSSIGGVTGRVKEKFQALTDKLSQAKSRGPLEPIKPESVDDAGELTDRVGGLNSGMTKSIALGSLMAKGFEMAVGAVQAFIGRAWEANTAVEKMRSRVQGLFLALSKDTPSEKFTRMEQSVRAANATLAEFREMGLKVAEQPAVIESGFSRINPVLMSLGKSQADAMEMTELAISAAKVYGADAEQSAGEVGKAIATGLVEGESAFASAFKMEAGLTSQMSYDARLKRVKEVLSKLGAPIETVTDTVEGAITRFSILSTGVLQKVTLPIFEKIGDVVGGIVKWMRENEDAVDAATASAAQFVDNILSVGQGVWDMVVGIGSFSVVAEQAYSRFKFLADTVDLIGQLLGLGGRALTTIGTYLEAINDPSGQGMAKFYALAEGLELKFLKIQNTLLGIINTLAKIVMPDVLRDKLPAGLVKFMDTMSELEKDVDRDILARDAALAKREKALGLDPTTETGKAELDKLRGLGMSKAERDALFRGIIGNKSGPLVQIDKVEVKQEFTDTDPDRILVEFVKDLERLSEAALQSSVSTGMIYGPGSAG